MYFLFTTKGSDVSYGVRPRSACPSPDADAVCRLHLRNTQHASQPPSRLSRRNTRKPTNMSDAAAAPKKKASKPNVPAAHPKYSEMIKQAITALKERGGSPRQAILKYICKNFKVGNDETKMNTHLMMALRAGVKNNSLKNSKGSGASGSFKLGEAAKKKAKKPKKAKTPKKKKAAKPKKAKSDKPKKAKTPKKKAAAKPKKAKADKPKKAKTPKKAAKPKAKKPAAKKPAAKKAKK